MTINSIVSVISSITNYEGIIKIGSIGRITDISRVMNIASIEFICPYVRESVHIPLNCLEIHPSINFNNFNNFNYRIVRENLRALEIAISLDYNRIRVNDIRQSLTVNNSVIPETSLEEEDPSRLEKYKKVNMSNININKDYLKQIFKYIPIEYRGQYGFYNPNINKVIIFKFNTATDKYDYLFINVDIEKALEHISYDCLLTLCKFKVINYRDSAKMFSYGVDKKKLVGNLVEVSKLELQSTVKRSDKLEDTIYVKAESKNLRFLLSDIQIIYPNLNGIYPKKDKIIKIGSVVKVVKDSKLPFKKNDNLVVSNIKKLGSDGNNNNRTKVYLGFKKNNDDNNIVYSDSRKFKFYK